jgi:hypothetical protein
MFSTGITSLPRRNTFFATLGSAQNDRMPKCDPDPAGAGEKSASLRILYEGSLVLAADHLEQSQGLKSEPCATTRRPQLIRRRALAIIDKERR